MCKFPHANAGLLTIAVGVLLASGSLGAASSTRSFVQNATGACQSALPVFDGEIRKRPLAVQNEGSASAYVSCSFVGTDRGVGDRESITEIYVYAINNTASTVPMSCTLVVGVVGSVTYFPRTLDVPANGLVGFEWNPADNGGANFHRVANISCNLPVGTGLISSYIYYDVDVGA